MSRVERVSSLSAVIRGGFVVALAAAVGWGAGHLWWTWWSPAPMGVVVEIGPDQMLWYPNDREVSGEQVFAAVGQYVLIGGAIALLVGLLAGLLSRRRELVGLMTALIAAVLGAAIMYRVGVNLSPPDPLTVADEVEEGARLPGTIAFQSVIPLLAWPLGSLLGYLIVVVLAPLDRSAGSAPLAPAPPLPPYAT